MLKTYYKYYTLKDGNGNTIRSDSWPCIVDENDAASSERTFTWDNIDEFDAYYLEMLSKRKGRKIIINSWDGRFVWKEWKHDLKLTERTAYKECNLSLEDIMKLRNSDLAIEYLKQRGLTVCPMK